MQPEIAAWRQHLHSRPELMFDVQETASFVATKLRAFGCDEVATGIGRTGLVGLIKGRHGPGPVIGLRADMDALPIIEASGLPFASDMERAQRRIPVQHAKRIVRLKDGYLQSDEMNTDRKTAGVAA